MLAVHTQSNMGSFGLEGKEDVVTNFIGSLASRKVDKSGDELDLKVGDLVCGIVIYDSFERKYLPKSNLYSLSDKFQKDFYDNSNLIISLAGRAIKCGTFIQEMNVGTSNGNSYPVQGVIVLDKHAERFQSDRSFAAEVSTAILTRNVYPIEVDSAGNLTKVYFPELLQGNKSNRLSAIAEVIPDVAKDCKYAKPDPTHRMLDNFALAYTEAKISFIPTDEYLEFHRNVCEQFNIAIPTPKNTADKKKSSKSCVIF